MIRAGGIVALPTETVYGLAGDATNAATIAAIYEAKGRPSFNPLIVHINNFELAARIASLNAQALALAEAFWPGPLTLLAPLRNDSGLAPAVTAGRDRVALRMPAHPVMRAVIDAVGKPLAAPSANASGGISPTSAAHVQRSLGSRVPLILDGGQSGRGLESTIIAVETDHIRLLRPGPITAEMLEQVSGLPVTSSSEVQSADIEAPGQLSSHYAPSKPVRLNATARRPGEYWIGFGAMECDDNLSESGDLAEAASALFAVLHRADMALPPAIAVAPIPATGIGVAINDRLARAAAK